MFNRPESDKLAVAAGQKKAEREYWIKKLSGELVKSSFPFDFQKSDWQKNTVDSITLKFPDELSQRLMKITGNSDVRLNIVLITGVLVLLEKYTGNEDIIIGTPIYKQNAEVEFINTVLIIKKEIYPDETFKNLILETGQVILEAAKNQNYPIERILYELNIDLNENESFPLFDIAVLLENLHDRKYLQHINTNIVFFFQEINENITGILEYNTSLYTKKTAEKIASHLLNLFQYAAFNTNASVSEIDILSEAEKKTLLLNFNNSQIDYPKNKTIVQLFHEKVQEVPDIVALVYGDKKLTYKKLHEMAGRLGKLLRVKGVQPDTPVGIMVERSIEMVIGIMGVLKAGGAYVPVNPDAPQERLRYVFDNANIKIVLTQYKYKANYLNTYDLVELDSETAYNCSTYSASSGILGDIGDDINNINKPGDIAYIIYTSGSTGKPKGVMIQHRSVINIIKWFARQYNLTKGFNLLQMFEYTFDASVNQIFGSLLHGVTLHIINKENFFNIEFLREYIINHSINLLNFVQSVIRELLCENKKLESLKYVISGAEKLKSSIKNEILDHGYALYNQYGPTEVTVDALAEKCSRESNGTVGIPVDNAQCYIVNKYGQLNPVGVAGELWVSGDGLARGYINNVELTAAKFIRNPFAPGTRIYKTGDLTRWLPKGNVEFLGRIDNQIKIRGFRIEPVEIANQLVKIEGITEAVVIDRDDGYGDIYLCAYLVGKQEIDQNEMKDILSKNLPDYMIPSAFVWIEKIPLSGHGKLIRSALPEPSFMAAETFVAPRNELEEKLTQIWAEILNIDQKIIGVNSDFFQLGGHSLKATILVAKIHKALNTKIPLAVVFQKPTISELAEYIEGNKKEIYTSLEAVEEKEYYVLSSAQKRLYILQQIVKDNTVYNLPNVIPLGNHIEKEKLESVFKKLIKRHESLRTNFIIAADEPVQKINKTVDFSIHCSNVSETDIESTIAKYIQPFDLSKAPLLRVNLLTVSPAQQILLVDMHHIITDGVSHTVLRKEFVDLYSGKELAPLRLQYKDYAEWQNSDRQKQLMKEQGRYWLEMFADEVPVLNLPTDFPRSMMQSFEGNNVTFILTAQDSLVLKELAKQTNATLYMCILSVVNVLLSRLSGQEDIVVGTPIAARRHADLEKIIGMFVNTLAMRNAPYREKRYREFLLELKERTFKAFENQEYQFEDLVDKLSVNRDTGRNPMFDVLFNLLNMQEYNENIPESAENEQFQYNHRKGTAKFDLRIAAVEIGEKFLFTFEYCTQLFKPETIDRFISYFKKLINSLSGNWDKKLAELEIITEKERRQVLDEFNNTNGDYLKNKTIHQLFEEQVEKTPGNMAVVGDVNRGQTVQITYRELNNCSNHIANLLKAKGVERGGIIGIMVEPIPAMVIGIIGTLKIGGIFLPIEPGLPMERVNTILDDSNTGIILAQAHLPAVFKTNVEVIHVEIIAVNTGESPNIMNCTGPTDPIYVIYTSGTTGRPKGVLINHRNMINYVSWFVQKTRLTSDKRAILTSSFAFDALYTQFFSSILTGCELHVIPRETFLFAEKLLNYLQRNKITYLKVTPSLFNLIVNNPGFSSEKLKGLHFVMLGGEAINIQDVEKAHKICPHLHIMNHYGPTETTIGSIAQFIDFDKFEEYKIVPTIGKPIKNTQVYILDKTFNIVPIGVAGELFIGGAGVGMGYLNRPELTSNKFNRSYRSNRTYINYQTGDLARWNSEGNIEFLGRSDDQVKIRGYRIEPGDIENRLVKYNGIKEAVVMVRGKKTGEKYLCAYYVSKQVIEVTLLREFLAEGLPQPMIPSYFVHLEKLPLTKHNKLNRAALPEPASEGSVGRTAPRDNVEIKLAEVWADVLMIDKEIIGIDDNFFQLGGHSLKATILVTKIQKIFNVNISLMEIFRAATIKNIASLIKIVNREEKEINRDQKMEEITI